MSFIKSQWDSYTDGYELIEFVKIDNTSEINGYSEIMYNKKTGDIFFQIINNLPVVLSIIESYKDILYRIYLSIPNGTYIMGDNPCDFLSNTRNKKLEELGI